MSAEPRVPAVQTVDLRKSFGALHAVDGVSLRVERGGAHAVIGPNGAGKTTLFDLLSGTMRPTSGRTLINGFDLTGRAPHSFVRAKAGRSFQTANLFDRLTVLENVRLAAYAGHPRSWRDALGIAALRRADVERAHRIVERIGLADRADAPVSALSHGEKRLVEVGMLLSQDLDVYLLDEPTAGLAFDEIPRLVDLVNDIAATGTVLMVEHNIGVVMRLCRAVTVMSRGRVIAEGSPEDIRRDPEVRASYLGDRGGLREDAAR